MNKTCGFFLLALALASLSAQAEPVATPTHAASAPAPANTKVPVPVAVPTPAQAKPGVPALPAASAPPVALPAAPVITGQQLLEQRRQQELVANAERIDKANRDLLAENQQLQLQNENLNIQVKVLQGDRSAEGIRNGALAVLAGLLAGWFFFASSRRNKGSW
jgi:hypothetical protein